MSNYKKYLSGEKPVTRKILDSLIKNDLDLRFLDTSEITDMSYLFKDNHYFNQDISRWNTSNVINMEAMFFRAKSFNQNINNWNVSNVINMSLMFKAALNFNQPLNNWNVSNVQKMLYMFNKAKSFNQPLNNWDISNVKLFYGFFQEASSFNQDLSKWKIKTDKLKYFFYDAISFNNVLPIEIIKYAKAKKFKIESLSILEKESSIKRFKINKELCDLNYLDSSSDVWYKKLSMKIQTPYFYIYELKIGGFIFVTDQLDCRFINEIITDSLKEKA